MIVLLIILTFLSQISGQAEKCTISSNQIGICVPITRCPEAISHLQKSKENPDLRGALQNLHQICGNHFDSKYPIICCVKPACQDLANKSGSCIDIRQCQPLVNELTAKRNDSELTQRMLRLNKICGSINQNVCCAINQTVGKEKKSAKLLTVDDGCGAPMAKILRIIGGRPARVNAYPWLVLLGYANQLGEIRWGCGGSLITVKHILTAAHCINRRLKIVRIGEHDLSREDESETMDFHILKTKVYDDYEPQTGHNDIAIIYLDGNTSRWESTLPPICLPFHESIRKKSFVGAKISPYVAGWGSINERGTPANVLQELQLPVIENDICRESFRERRLLKSDNQFDNATLCVGILTGGMDVCSGDSGGPLMARELVNGKPVFFQIGIVSWGSGCARIGIPTVFTRVVEFLDWIEDMIQ